MTKRSYDYSNKILKEQINEALDRFIAEGNTITMLPSNAVSEYAQDQIDKLRENLAKVSALKGNSVQQEVVCKVQKKRGPKPKSKSVSELRTGSANDEKISDIEAIEFIQTIKEMEKVRPPRKGRLNKNNEREDEIIKQSFLTRLEKIIEKG